MKVSLLYSLILLNPKQKADVKFQLGKDRIAKFYYSYLIYVRSYQTPFFAMQYVITIKYCKLQQHGYCILFSFWWYQRASAKTQLIGKLHSTVEKWYHMIWERVHLVRDRYLKVYMKPPAVFQSPLVNVSTADSDRHLKNWPLAPVLTQQVRD